MSVCLLLFTSIMFTHTCSIHRDIHNESLNANEYVWWDHSVFELLLLDDLPVTLRERYAIDLGDGFLWCFFRHGTMGIAPLRFLFASQFVPAIATKSPRLLYLFVKLKFRLFVQAKDDAAWCNKRYLKQAVLLFLVRAAPQSIPLWKDIPALASRSTGLVQGRIVESNELTGLHIEDGGILQIDNLVYLTVSIFKRNNHGFQKLQVIRQLRFSNFKDSVPC